MPNGYALEDDEVVLEMPIYAGGATLGPSKDCHGYVIQFPLRTPDHPYDHPSRVRLKSKVKRMDWEVPLHINTNYNRNTNPTLQLRSHTLLSSRIDPGMEGLAVGVRQDDALILFPASEVLQLRHSPWYLNKEEEGSKTTKKSASSGGSNNGHHHKEMGSASGGRSEAGTSYAHDNGNGYEAEVKDEEGGPSGSSHAMMPITVQVKRHETEQQTEARLRSYAFHASQEEADDWIPLQYRSESSAEALALWAGVSAPALQGPVVSVTHSPSVYLDAVVPGNLSSGRDSLGLGDEGGLSQGGARHMHRAGNSVNTNGTGSRHQKDVIKKGEGQLTPDALAALPSQLAAVFTTVHVLSLENVRAMLLKLPSHGVLNRAGATASDAALHSAIMDIGSYLCVRKSYMPIVCGNPAIDPLRTVVLQLLQEKESLRRGEVFAAAGAAHISVSDTTYSKVMKELCVSHGSVWTLKAGSEIVN